MWTFDYEWPGWARRRLQANELSMPAGELFAAVVGKVMAEDVMGASALLAVTDCMPVSGAVNAQTSPSPQLHELVKALYRTKKTTQVMAVHVRREHNQIADDLSKRMGEEVRSRAAAAGFRVERWHNEERMARLWAVLCRAATLEQGV